MKTIQLIRTPKADNNKYVDAYINSIYKIAEQMDIDIILYTPTTEAMFNYICQKGKPTLVLEPCDWHKPDGMNDLEKNCTAKVLYYLCADLREQKNLNKVLIVNRSKLIGKPLVRMLLEDDFTITIAHSKSGDLSELIKANDIIIFATGHKQNYDCSNKVVLDASDDYTGNKEECNYVGMKEIGTRTTKLMLSGVNL